MTETCTTCGLWKGLHRWDTMQCPANGHEDGQFRQTTYTEENAELAALRAERDELRDALEAFVNNDAAGIVSLNAHAALIDNARAVLAKYEAK